MSTTESIEKVLQKYRDLGIYTEEQIETIRKSLINAKDNKTDSKLKIDAPAPSVSQTDLDISNVREAIEAGGKPIEITDNKTYEDKDGEDKDSEDIEYVGQDTNLVLGEKQESTEVEDFAETISNLNSEPLLYKPQYTTINEYRQAQNYTNEFMMFSDTPGMQPYSQDQITMMNDLAGQSSFARQQKSVFSDDKNDGKGNYTYNLNGANVVHDEKRNGAIDFDSFRLLSTSQARNVEKYISNQLNAYHNEYRKMRKNDNNPEGLDNSGYYYTFDWTMLDGDDVLKIYRSDAEGLTGDVLEMDLPTIESEDFEGMWTQVYQKYLEFTSPLDKNAKKQSVDQVVFDWNAWALDMKGSESLQEYITKIQPNTYKSEEGGKYEPGGLHTVRPGNKRGGIMKVDYQKGIGVNKQQFKYWTSGRRQEQLFADGGGIDAQPFNVRYSSFEWPPNSKTFHYYEAFTDFVPPEYDKEGKLIDAGSIGKFEAYEYMYDDYTRGKKVIEDVFYKAIGDEYDYAEGTGGEIIGEAMTVKKESETNTTNDDKLEEINRKLEKDIYSETSYLEPITFVDIQQRIVETQKNIVDSKEFGEKWLNTQINWSTNFNHELEKLLEPHKQEIDNTLNSEFKDEIKVIQDKVNKLNNSFNAQDQTLVDTLSKEIESQLLKEYEKGDIDINSQEEFEAEFEKRLKKAYDAHANAVYKDRQSQRNSLLDPFNEKYNKRYQELTSVYAGDFIDEKTKELQDLYYDFQSDFIKKSYENKSNGAEQLISDETYTEIFKRLHDQNIHGYGYKVKQKAIDLEWAKLSASLKALGLSSGEIDERREEFYYKAYEKITLDKENKPTAAAMKTYAEELVNELSQLDDLTDEEKESLRYAEEILDAKEFMSSTGFGRYFDGMFSKDFADIIPIYAGIRNGNIQNHIRKLLKKPVEQLTDREKETLLLWSESEKLEAKILQQSNSYSAGAGTVDSFRFMLEMIASRGIGKFVNRFAKIAPLATRGRLLNRSQEVINRFSKIKNIPVGTLKIQDKAATAVDFLLKSSTMTGIGGSSMIYEQTIERMTPEMAWSLTSDGENVSIQVDKLGFYVGDDANGNPIYEQDKGWDEAFVKAFGSTWVEYATERFGMYIPGGVNALSKNLIGNPAWLKRMTLGRYARKLGLNPASANFLARVQRAGGWNGILPEIAEEFIAQPLQNLIDGRGFLDGIDSDFTQQVIIQTGAMQIMFGAGNKAYKLYHGIKDPVYIVGLDSYSNATDAIEAIKLAKKEGKLKDLKIEISNDFNAFEQAFNELEGTGFENNLDSKNLIDVIEDVAASIEVEAVNKLPQNKVEEVEDLTKKIEQLEEQLEEKTKNNTKNKKEVIDEIISIKSEINKLNKQKSKILDPVIAAVNKERSSKDYKEKLDAIKKFSEDVDPGTDVIELETSEEAAEFYEIDALNRLLSDYNISVIRNATTGKRVYIDNSTNTTLSLKDLNQLDFGNLTFDQLNQTVQDNKNEFDLTHGFTTPTVDGKQSILINKSTSLKLGAKNVAAHEFLHRFLNKTFNKNPHLKLAVGRALQQQLMNMNPKGIRNSDFQKRLTSYQAQQGEIISAEETLNLFSDALVKGEMIYNETTATKIGDMFRRAFSRGGKRVTFDTGRDVMNFIRDYNRAIETKRLSKGLKRTMLKGARVGGQIKYGSDQYAKALQKLGLQRDDEGQFPLMSKEASDRVQAIYNEKGADGIFEIIKEFKPITGKLVERRRNAPNFDRELLTSEIEIGKGGIIDLVRTYKSESGVPLAAYINQNLPLRAIEASRRVLGEEFTQDVTEATGIAAEEVTTPTKKPKKKVILSERLGVKNKVNESIKKLFPNLNIKDLTFKKLKNLVPDVTGELFGISPKKLITNANITKGELQAAQMFINKNADILIAMLPEGSTAGGTSTGVPKTILDAFYTKTDRAKMAKTGTKAGLAIQVKNKINRKDFLEVFGIINGKPDRTDRNTSARVLSLANLTGKMMSNQAVRQQIENTSPDYQQAINNIKDGTPDVMFSKEASDEITTRTKIKNFAEKYGFNYVGIDGNITAFDNLIDDAITIGSYRPGVLRAVDLYTWNEKTKNVDFQEYLRARAREIPEAFHYQSSGGVNKKEAGIKRYPRMDVEFYKGKKSLDETNETGRYNFLAFWNMINDAYVADQKLPKRKQSKTLLTSAYHLALSSINDTSHPSRTGAPIKWIDKKAKGVAKRRVKFEHAIANIDVIETLMDAIAEGNFKQTLDNILRDDVYVQSVILKTDATALDAVQKINTLKDFDLTKDTFVNRMFNKATASNVDYKLTTENLVLVKDNSVSVGSKYGINKIGEYRFSKDNIEDINKIDDAVIISRLNNKKPKGISVLDFDDTLATTKSEVIVIAPDRTTTKINAEEFAKNGSALLDQGFTFDFSEFSKVVGAKKAPLFQKALKLQKKFGSENMFVLTARPADSAKPIFRFLRANGLNIPLKNITGLGNSTSEAKALWIADKVAEGYNDFYFADDALQNVEAVANMLDQFDVKSKVQQAKVKFSKDINKDFNRIIQQTTGVESFKVFSEAQARLRGNKTKYQSIIPPSAQDFQGLLYNFLSKGKLGEQQFEFFKKALIDPFARGIRELNTSRQKSAEDLENLFKDFKSVKNKLNKKIGDSNFTFDQAIRVYLWNKFGFDVPGLSKKDLNLLTSVVNNDAELQSFAETLGLISKRKQGYGEPSDYWLTENIKSDLLSDGAIGDLRSKFLEEWQQNADVIFSTQNLNKIQAIYGSKFREAIEDMLYRMKTGRSRPTGSSRLVNNFMNWTNNSVGAIMFFNMRSALLQTISAINYINWSDNNVLNAGKAFANQPQYWKDFTFLFNSDFLKQRRAGNQRGINEAELSDAVAGAENKAKAAIAWLLKKGFLPTQIADSFAIASGGSTFYRNRINSLIKQGMTQQEAEAQAFLDFQELTEVAQQSARPDLISQQQASPLGRLILAFQNTPMQYARIMNKAARDLVNGRGDYKTHISKIIYYGVVQGIIFGSLQSALFAALGDDDEDKERFETKRNRILNQMIDSVLSGIGYGGKAISTTKNTIMEFLKQKDKGFRADHAYTLLTLLSFSPPIGSKLRKIYTSIQTDKWNEDVYFKRGLTLDNPIWNAIGNVVEGATNIPLGRLSNKMLNIDNALDSNNEWWQRVALVLGWNTWDLGIRDKDIEAVKTKIKEEKKEKKKIENKIKKEEKKKQKEKEKIEEEKQKLRNKYPNKSDVEINKIIKQEEKTKQVFDLNKREQVKIIEGLNLNPNNYKKEQDRVDIIMQNYNKNPNKMDSTLTAIENYVPSKQEQRSIDLFKTTKKDQVNMLIDLGLSPKQIKQLKYEEDRVKKIIQLENKKKVKN